MALTRSDIDFKSKTIKISKTATRTGISTPKTFNSNRIVTVDEKTLEILRNYMDTDLCGKQLLWCLPSGKFYDPDNVNSWLAKIFSLNPQLRKIRVHVFRHTHVSQLLALGVSPVDVAKRIGDRLSTVNNVYAHSIGKNSDKLSDLFSNQYRIQ